MNVSECEAARCPLLLALASHFGSARAERVGFSPQVPEQQAAVVEQKAAPVVRCVGRACGKRERKRERERERERERKRKRARAKERDNNRRLRGEAGAQHNWL
jgi:hypothetical protein